MTARPALSAPSPGLPGSLVRALLLVALVAVTACAAADRAAVPQGSAPPSTSVLSLIGDAACASDAECRTIGVGARACGGPQSYRAWSTRRTDAAALAAASWTRAAASSARA